jgi:hypothetical protein
MTAFPPGEARVTKPNWWTDILGTAPDERNEKAGGSIVRETGTLGDGKLVLDLQPGRIEWALGANEEDALARGEMPVIGVFPEVVGPLTEISTKWFTLAPPLRRIAFGANLYCEVPDQPVAYQTLASLLPTLRIDVGNSSDLLYRINRPRPAATGVSGLMINRISTWSAVLFQQLQLQVGVASGAAITRRVGEGSHFCHLELDINTSPDFPSDLPRERLAEIYRELVGIAIGISEGGDVP